MFNNNHSNNDEVLFISSYPPRECGIASYTRDLINALRTKFSSSFSIKICALEKHDELMVYPDEVKYVLDQSNRSSYVALANAINDDQKIKMVFFQHEFGLFGGEYGDYLLDLLNELEKPVSITFHTVIPSPNEKLKITVQNLIELTENVIVMTDESASILQKEYDINGDVISIIPHGTHIIKYKDKSKSKKKYRLEDRLILSTFGLLSSNKSIETALDALPKIIAVFPNVLYIILGKTHPNIVSQEGEIYREFLEGTVQENNLENNVLFVNKYLELDELLDYLCMTDIYLFTSKDPHQAVSGTFAYAMSSACPIISTPIPHAVEMLSEDTGIFFDFQNSEQLASKVIHLLGDDGLREEMGLKAFQKTRAHIWENSASNHAKIFAEYFGKKKLTFDTPEVHLNHIYSLTDNIGMIQFSNISDPDINSGYTLDDNARALIAIVQHYALTGDFEDLALMKKYIGFIDRCQQADGSFLNYVDKEGVFHIQNENINLEDSNGRAIWAIGVLIANERIIPQTMLTLAQSIFARAYERINQLKSPRAIAFTIKGLYFYNLTMNRAVIDAAIDNLADLLVQKYQKAVDEDWVWFEDNLTYANSVLPEALLYAYLATNHFMYRWLAHVTFEFLLSHMFTDTSIKMISNNGWRQKGGVSQSFGEQPIDVSYTIQALDLFYSVFKEEDYLNKMEIAFSWFLGNNHLNQIIYNPLTGGCYDGLEENNVNLNQGAESAVCYLTARLIIERIKIDFAKNKIQSIRKRMSMSPNIKESLMENDHAMPVQILTEQEV